MKIWNMEVHGWTSSMMMLTMILANVIYDNFKLFFFSLNSLHAHGNVFIINLIHYCISTPNIFNIDLMYHLKSYIINHWLLLEWVCLILFTPIIFYSYMNYFSLLWFFGEWVYMFYAYVHMVFVCLVWVYKML
jgi:hypothetical protein